jgi:hypothetical protein
MAAAPAALAMSPPAAQPPPMASTAPSAFPQRAQPAQIPQQTLPTIPEVHEEADYCLWPAAVAGTRKRPAAAVLTAPRRRHRSSSSATSKPQPQQPKGRLKRTQQEEEQQPSMQQKEQVDDQSPRAADLELAPASADEHEVAPAQEQPQREASMASQSDRDTVDASSMAATAEQGSVRQRRRVGGASQQRWAPAASTGAQTTANPPCPGLADWLAASAACRLSEEQRQAQQQPEPSKQLGLSEGGWC